MIVSPSLLVPTQLIISAGEELEKVTRVLTDEDKALLEVEFVGKNGQKRKMEACDIPFFTLACELTLCLDDYGSTKVEEVSAV